jgi:vitamin B12 transporter
LSGAWQVDETGTRLHASIGTGFNTPTLFDLFGSVPGIYLGNPNLRPESSLGWDIGAEQTFFDIFKLDATYFNATLNDRLKGFASTITNDIGISHRQGIELAATLDLMNGFTVGSTYTYTDARNADGTVAIRRPKHIASLDAAYTFEAIPLRLNASLNFNGEMLDDDLTTKSKTTLPAYSTVNLGLEYKVSDSVDIYGRIENLFDTRYQEVHGYNAPGRAAFVGVKAKIQ